MGMLAWVILGLALWHYTIWLPDRFWGGIVGAFLGSIAGAIVTGVLISAAVKGVAIPGRHATDLAVVLYGAPGALLGMAAVYVIGAARERTSRHAADGL
jgi:hypothetical protein